MKITKNTHLTWAFSGVLLSIAAPIVFMAFECLSIFWLPSTLLGGVLEVLGLIALVGGFLVAMLTFFFTKRTHQKRSAVCAIIGCIINGALVLFIIINLPEALRISKEKKAAALEQLQK